MMLKRLSALAALLSCLALVGCASALPSRPQAAATAPAATPRPTAQPQATPLVSGIVDNIWVDVYPGTTFTSQSGCGCNLPGSKSVLFPAGTRVLLLKITLTGMWTPNQGNAKSQDVTGTTVAGTKFDGRPELAVLDSADGPAAAAQAGLPWLPTGLFAGHKDWTIPNQRSRSFAAAWYLPSGVDQLELTVNVPEESQPNVLTVPLTAQAVQQSMASGE